MKRFEVLVAWIAFGLSSVVAVSLFSGIAYWAFGQLGTVQQQIVATAVAAPLASAALRLQ